MKIIVSGSFDIADESGQKVHAVAGDVFYFPKGTTSSLFFLHCPFSKKTYIRGVGWVREGVRVLVTDKNADDEVVGRRKDYVYDGGGRVGFLYGAEEGGRCVEGSFFLVALGEWGTFAEGAGMEGNENVH